MGHRTTEEGRGTQKSGNVDWGYWGEKGKKCGQRYSGRMRRRDEKARQVQKNDRTETQKTITNTGCHDIHDARGQM